MCTINFNILSIFDILSGRLQCCGFKGDGTQNDDNVKKLESAQNGLNKRDYFLLVAAGDVSEVKVFQRIFKRSSSDEQESLLIAEQPIETVPPLQMSYLQALMTKRATPQAPTHLIMHSTSQVPVVEETTFWGKPDRKPGSSSIPAIVERALRNEVKPWIGIPDPELGILEK